MIRSSVCRQPLGYTLISPHRASAHHCRFNIHLQGLCMSSQVLISPFRASRCLQLIVIRVPCIFQKGPYSWGWAERNILPLSPIVYSRLIFISPQVNPAVTSISYILEYSESTYQATSLCFVWDIDERMYRMAGLV